MEAKNKRKYLWIAIISVVSVAVAWWYLFVNLPGSIRQNGGVEALFTGLAFALLIVTAIMQKDELELQRKELEQTREELKGQKEQMEGQNVTLRRQRFEATFFRLLTMYNEGVERLAVDPDELVAVNIIEPRNGRDVFEALYTETEALMKDSIEKPEYKSKLRDVLDDNLSCHEEGALSKYFRRVNHLLQFIENSGINIGDKQLYTAILTTEMTGWEILVLYYYGLCKECPRDFITIGEKCGLFHNLPQQDMIDWRSDLDLYKDANKD